MQQPQPPRGDPLDEAMIAWANASAHLAATIRNQPLRPPQLTICQPARCGGAAAALAVAYWWWARTYHCAWQWHFAFEIHPLFRGIHWMTAAGVSIIWQLWDRLKAIAGSEPGVSGPSPLSGERPGVMLHHRHRLPPGDTHGIHRVTASR